MATLFFDKLININAKAAWEMLGDPGSIHRLLSILESAQIEGDRRVCKLRPGLPMAGELNETIYSVDPERMRVAYTITSSPFGFTHHSASMQLIADGPGRARFLWTTDVKPDSVSTSMGPIFEQEAEHIARALEKN